MERARPNRFSRCRTFVVSVRPEAVQRILFGGHNRLCAHRCECWDSDRLLGRQMLVRRRSKSLFSGELFVRTVGETCIDVLLHAHGSSVCPLSGDASFTVDRCWTGNGILETTQNICGLLQERLCCLTAGSGSIHTELRSQEFRPEPTRTDDVSSAHGTTRIRPVSRRTRRTVPRRKTTTHIVDRARCLVCRGPVHRQNFV